jgi:hypothetical protein
MRVLDVSGIDAGEGTAKRDDAEVRFTYDAGKSELELNVVTLPPYLTADGLRSTIEAAMDGADVDKPKDAGFYQWVIPTIDNQTDQDLTLSSSSLKKGMIKSPAQRIAAGISAEAFRACNEPALLAGAEGEVTFVLDDGTTLELTYWLKSEADYTFVPGLGGGQQRRHKLDVKDATPTTDCYTYLLPTLTLSDVT